MRPTVIELQIPIPVIAVLLFVLGMIALLLIVDSKARIQAGETTGRFSISGMRRDHPVWAWMVSFLLWTILAALLFMGIRNLVAGLWPSATASEEDGLLAILLQEEAVEQRRAFHNAREPLAPGDGVVCTYCHGDYPHADQEMVRSLLNMHTQFIGCLTCHADADKIPEEELTFRWLNFSGIKVSGPPFGTHIDPETGGLVKTDDYYSKIVAYRMGDIEEELLEIPGSRPDAREFISKRGELTRAQEGAAKRRFHANVNSQGRFCARCHTDEKEFYLPLRELGFSDERVDSLTNLNIVGIVQKYREFYIPTIFRQNMSEKEERTVLGREIEVPAGGTIQTNPRDWWRERYDARPEPRRPDDGG